MSRVWIAAMLVLLGSARASLAEHTVVTVTGAEQQASSGVFDKGSLTVTINGYSETIGYGQFSTNASLASGIAAKFSQDCNSTVLAHASGAAITFITKDPAAAIGSVVATLSWDGQDFSAASFALNTPAPPVFTPGINCVPSTIVSGQSLTCDVILLAGASSPVTFSIGGSVWTSATPDQAGSAVANAAVTNPAGTYTIAYSYPGDANIPAASGTAQVNVTATGSAPAGSGIYSFSIADQYGNSGYAPNSNVTAYTDSVNGTWSLGYDSLNRLTSSSQTAANGSAQWGCWAYDSFGNMQTQGISNQTFSNLVGCQAQPGANTLQSSLNYNASNQIGSGTWLDANKNSHTGSPVYDAAGDMMSDLLNNYLYNAQGQVCAVQTGPNSFTGYLYDAEGHRVAKGTLPSLTCDPTNLQITSAYFIGPDGETMTEIDGNGSWVRTEVSGAGQYLATYTPTGIHYPITDWLGTKRVTVNPNNTLAANGVEETCTSFPFGDQQNCNTPIDASARHFTGKERDAESGLDYFGARYYASSMGRWMSPDWADKPEAVPYSSLDNPQSLNLYGYVGNNPLSRADADGHCCSWDEVKDFSVGALKGTVASLTGGAMGSAPSPYDSSASLNGQLFGAAAVTATGVVTDIDAAGKVGGGMVLAPETGGISLVVSGAGVAEGVVGTALVKGGTSEAANVAQAMKAHGNTAGSQPAELYEKYDKDGNFEKHGVSQDASKRYSKAEVNGGEVRVTERGPRKEMLAKERQKVETNPGPKNHEPWAGKQKQQ